MKTLCVYFFVIILFALFFIIIYNMKKLFLLLFSLFSLSIFSYGLVFAGWTPAKTDFFWQNTKHLPWVPNAPKEESKDLRQEDPNGWVNGLLATVKNTINRVLGLLALIALIILIYQGVMMLVYARDSKKIEEWYTTVKNVAIALVFIWVSWLIVSFIFRAIWVFTKTT